MMESPQHTFKVSIVNYNTAFTYKNETTNFVLGCNKMFCYVPGGLGSLSAEYGSSV